MCIRFDSSSHNIHEFVFPTNGSSSPSFTSFNSASREPLFQQNGMQAAGTGWHAKKRRSSGEVYGESFSKGVFFFFIFFWTDSDLGIK